MDRAGVAHPGGGLGAVWVVRDQSDPSSGRDASQGTPLADSRTAELAATQESTALVPTDAPPSLRGIATVVGRATGLPLTPTNSVEVLVNGDQAYPACSRR